MKAVLVIEEMPTECIECQFCRVFADNKPTETHCSLMAKRNKDGVNTRAEWCPLKPMPKEKHDDEENLEEASYMCGWNACLEELENA